MRIFGFNTYSVNGTKTKLKQNVPEIVKANSNPLEFWKDNFCRKCIHSYVNALMQLQKSCGTNYWTYDISMM